MDKVQVIVFARDGVVQAVESSLGKRDINITVVDWDNYDPEYDESGIALKKIKKEIAKIRKENRMKTVW